MAVAADKAQVIGLQSEADRARLARRKCDVKPVLELSNRRSNTGNTIVNVELDELDRLVDAAIVNRRPDFDRPVAGKSIVR